MARRPTKEKHPLSLVLIHLRQKLRLTQAALAARLGVSLPVVGKWESFGPPKGKTLQRLMQFAESEQEWGAAAAFRTAADMASSPSMPLWMSLGTEKEVHYTLAMLSILRDAEFKKLRPKLARLMAAALKANEPMLEQTRRGMMAREMTSQWVIEPDPPTTKKKDKR